MSQLHLSLLVGLFAYALYGIAVVLMKHGADVIMHPKTMLATRASAARALVWIAGATTNFMFVVILTVALGLGHASVVCALNGFGLVVMAVLSRVCLKERVFAIELCGMTLVILGVTLIGYFAPQVPGPLNSYRTANFLLYSGVVCGVSAALVAYTLARRFHKAAVIFGVTAGVLGGISMMIQKIFVTPVLGRGLSAAQIATALATSRLVYIFIVVSMGAFVMVQVAYQFGRAIQVIPATVSAMILTPVMGGILVFGEIMTPWQSAGTIFIVVGVILLSAFNKESKVAAEAIPAP